MNSFHKTLEWFDIHNDHLFHFKKTESQIQEFCHYIKDLSKEPSLIEIFKSLNISKIKDLNHMKMTIFENIV